MILLPPNNQWKALYSGEVFGSLYATRNINFDEDGYLKLALKSTAIGNDVSNFGYIKSIQYVNTASNAGYYIMTSNHQFRLTAAGTITDIDTTNLSGGTNLDGCAWQGKWYYSRDTEARSFDGSSVSAAFGSGDIDTGKQHPLCVFENLNYLAVGNGAEILLYDTSHSLQKTITLPSNFEVRWLVWKDNLLFIGTKNTAGGKAMLFTADGSSTSATSGYEADGNWLLSGCVYKTGVATVSSNGQLLFFNGGGFTELANFPIYKKDIAWYSSFVHGNISHRGMVADGEIIYINVDAGVKNTQNFLANFHSGLWQYTPSISLYHKAGNGHNKLYALTATVDTSTNIFTVSSYTSPTGTMVGFYNASDDTEGLKSGNLYFLIRLTSTTFKLALTYDDAVAGTAIDINSSGSARTFYFAENDEAGRTIGVSSNPGAVQLISDLDDITTYLGFTRSTVLYGAGAVSNNTISGTSSTLNSLTKGFNIGYFITQKIRSQNITEVWQAIQTKLNRVWEGCDKVIVKYRTKNRQHLPVISTSAPTSGNTATWVSATQFTTTKDLSMVEEGDEIEFIDGRCAGYTAHISSCGATNPSGTWLVNIDESLPNVTAGDKSYFVIDNWTKAGTITGSDIAPDEIFKVSDLGKSKWIQLKIELRGVSEPVVEETQVINATHKPSI